MIGESNTRVREEDRAIEKGEQSRNNKLYSQQGLKIYDNIPYLGKTSTSLNDVEREFQFQLELF